MRSPVIAFLLISLLSVKAALSQSDELIIQGQTGKLWLLHTVAAKENWYSIGRLYNENPKTIAPYNKLTMNKPLVIGQEVQIPLTAVNFSQNGQKAANETLVPVYHVIQEKEWMYRISVNHNKVPIPSLEKWNKIDNGEIKAGMHLIVGYLKVKTALSAFAKTGGAPSAPPISASITPAIPAKTVSATAPNAAPVNTTSTPPATTPVTPPATTPITSPATTPITSSAAPVTTLPSTTLANKPTDNKPTTPAVHFNGGFFKTDYTDGGRTAAGSAGTFKSSSGWQDGKYYALMNNVAVGTIVKITIAATARTIYAKVLGQLPEMKESAGLTVRISNAAASELGAGDGRFNVEMKY